MSQTTLCDEFIDFIYEFTDLLKQDWEKTKKFIKANTKYVYWVIVLFITMQFTDIINLGKSYDKFCKSNNIIQRGGANGAGNAGASSASSSSSAPPSSGSAASAAGADGAAAGPAAGAAPLPAKLTAPGKAENGANGAKPPTLPEEKEKKDKKSLFGKTKRGIADSIKNNPVFGHLDKIFNMVESIAIIITFILVVVGVLSLPILIFIAITYCIVKKVLSYFLYL